MIKGDKIKLRALEPEDLELLYLWENQVSYWPYSGQFSMFSKAILSNYIENATKDIFLSGQYRYAIVELSTDMFIGCIDLYQVEALYSRAGVGILIGNEKQRKKGFAKDALKTLCKHAKVVLQLNQLYCEIFLENKASINLFESCGFVKTGEKKEWYKVAGHYRDVGFFQCIF